MKARHDLDIIKQGSLTVLQRQVVLTQVQQVLDSMNKALLKELSEGGSPRSA